MNGPSPLPDQPARFAVMGLLVEDARTYCRPGGTVLLEVVVAQHLQAHPEARNVVARLAYPDRDTPNATAAAASSKAHRLRAGAEVIVTGSALYPGHRLGEPVTVLDDVRSIELNVEDIPTPYAVAG